MTEVSVKREPTLAAGDASGAFRVIYVATFADAGHVLHAFQKTSQATPRSEQVVHDRRRLHAARGEIDE